MTKKLNKQLDEIKDLIDELHDIKNPQHRLEASTDLIEYIGIHIRDQAEHDVMERQRERARNRRSASCISRSKVRAQRTQREAQG